MRASRPLVVRELEARGFLVWQCAEAPFVQDVLRRSHTEQAVPLALRCILLATTALAPPPLPFNGVQTTSMHVVVLRVISASLRMGADSSNILAHGYRTRRDCELGSAVHAALDVENIFPSSLVNELLTKPWEELLSAIGDDAMAHLLSTAVVLVPLANGCFYQLAGPLLTTTLKAKAWAKTAEKKGGEDAAAAVAVKVVEEERRDGGGSRSSRAGAAAPSAVAAAAATAEAHAKRARGSGKRPSTSDAIPRASILYAASFATRAGLPRRHALQQHMPPSNSNARRLLRRVMLLPLGAAAPSPGAASAAPLPTPPRRLGLPRRLRGNVVTLFREVLERARRFDCAALLRRHCPLPDALRHRRPLGGTAATTTTRPTPNAAQQLAALLGGVAPHNAVRDFLIACAGALLPDALWGSAHNCAAFERGVALIVGMHRHEKCTLARVMHGVRSAAMPWQSPSLTTRWISWVFNELLLPLLRAHFYITEAEGRSQRVLYYRKPVWAAISSTRLRALSEGEQPMFAALTRSSAARILSAPTRQFGVALMRFAPKGSHATKVRTIMNLSSWSRAAVDPLASLRKSDSCATPSLSSHAKKKWRSSTNRRLADVFEILKYEWFANAALQGASVRNLDDIFKSLDSYLAPLHQRPGGVPPLYIVAADVTSCYDNIPPDRLLQVLKGVIQSDVYMLHSHTVVIPKPSLGVMRMQKLTSVEPQSRMRTKLRYADIAAELATKRYHDVVFVDGVEERRISQQAIRKQLKEHLTRNIVTFRNCFLRQRIGIPQGSVLSSLLCNIYYARVLEVALNCEMVDPCKTLLRMTDDFLFITTSFDVAKKFASTLIDGNPTLRNAGCVINPAKTVLSFTMDGCCKEPFWLPWCGLRIHTASARIRSDYARLNECSLREQLNIVAVHREHGSVGIGGTGADAALAKKMVDFMKPTIVPVLLSSTVNDGESVASNFASTCTLAAVKLRVYATVLRAVSHLNVALLEWSVDWALSLVRRRVVKCALSDSDLRVVARRAFRCSNHSLLFPPSWLEEDVLDPCVQRAVDQAIARMLLYR
jgi:telomerase reverse transcriptase